MARVRITETGEGAPRGDAGNGFSFSSLRQIRLSCLVRLLLSFSFLLLLTIGFVTPTLFFEVVVPSFLASKLSGSGRKESPLVQNPETRLDLRRRNFIASRDALLAFAANTANVYEDKKIKLILSGKADIIRQLGTRWRNRGRAHRNIGLTGNPNHASWLMQLQLGKYVDTWPQFLEMTRTWSQNRHYDPKVMHHLLRSIKEPLDEYFHRRKEQPAKGGKRFKSCAVVGNSGILLNMSLGRLIDGHDMVMRVNNAPIRGYEQFVGSKTTLSFINSNVFHACAARSKFFCHPHGSVPLVVYICQAQHMMDIAFCSSGRVAAPILVTDPRLDFFCSRLVRWYSARHFVETTGLYLHFWSTTHSPKHFHYSSGFQAVVLALGICEHVNLFGFGKSRQAKHHYHNSQSKELNLHDYEAEYLFYDDLANNRTSSIPFFSEAPGFVFPRVEVFKLLDSNSSN